MSIKSSLVAARISICLFLTCLLLSTSLDAQILQKDPDKYIIGDSEKLEIIVHVWGQVRTPGRYVVEDGTDVLELISLAGGPTTYANMSKVKLTRGEYFPRSADVLVSANSDSLRNIVAGEINTLVNIQKYLDLDEGEIPVLGPGDVVRVPKNTWFGFEAAVRIVAQLAIVAQVYYWYSRSY
ncbi:hypothetical protein EH223_07940 [candidate division KSB1 bacterium]|nr:SLBB domain-containing protein [candidate division KSB1 bacterium]RQW04123.1 MAG: hypothetical protein EH223_07940 [candidate division KSB1 bacterium]